MDNKGPDQPAHKRRLIRACVVHKLNKGPFHVLSIVCNVNRVNNLHHQHGYMYIAATASFVQIYAKIKKSAECIKKSVCVSGPCVLDIQTDSPYNSKFCTLNNYEFHKII